MATPALELLTVKEHHDEETIAVGESGAAFFIAEEDIDVAFTDCCDRLLTFWDGKAGCPDCLLTESVVDEHWREYLLKVSFISYQWGELTADLVSSWLSESHAQLDPLELALKSSEYVGEFLLLRNQRWPA